MDLGHVGGLSGLTDHYTLGRALDPGAVYPSSTYAQWRAELRDNGVPEGKLRSGGRYTLDGAALDVLLPAALNVTVPSAPVALRLAVGHVSMLLLNRAALDADPAALTAGGRHSDTVLVLAAGPSDPAAYGSLIALLHPRLVVLPSGADPRNEPAADAVARKAAHSIGAQVWQAGSGASLTLTTDGLRHTQSTQAP